jgi:hypothetical protein
MQGLAFSESPYSSAGRRWPTGTSVNAAVVDVDVDQACLSLFVLPILYVYLSPHPRLGNILQGCLMQDLILEDHWTGYYINAS